MGTRRHGACRSRAPPWAAHPLHLAGPPPPPILPPRCPRQAEATPRRGALRWPPTQMPAGDALRYRRATRTCGARKQWPGAAKCTGGGARAPPTCAQPPQPSLAGGARLHTPPAAPAVRGGERRSRPFRSLRPRGLLEITRRDGWARSGPEVCPGKLDIEHICSETRATTGQGRVRHAGSTRSQADCDSATR